MKALMSKSKALTPARNVAVEFMVWELGFRV